MRGSVAIGSLEIPPELKFVRFSTLFQRFVRKLIGPDMREIVLDTETTGLDPYQGHRLVEVGCIELINRIPSGQVFHRYLNPERDMPAASARLSTDQAWPGSWCMRRMAAPAGGFGRSETVTCSPGMSSSRPVSSKKK